MRSAKWNLDPGPRFLDPGNARFAGRESNFLMNAIWKILTAVFGAGIASLLMELSLLREFIYVVGSSAFSNALIISIFLAGLATGTYVGAWKRLQSPDERQASTSCWTSTGMLNCE